MAVPLTQPPGNRNVAGDFHRPYGTLEFLDFTIHRSTLPQGGERENMVFWGWTDGGKGCIIVTNALASSRLDLVIFERRGQGWAIRLRF